MKSALFWKLVLVLAVSFSLTCGGDDGGGEEEPEVKECKDPTPYELDGKCVKCTEDDHCPGDQTCLADYNECACPDLTPYFDGAACRECEKDAHCDDGDLCDECTFTCVWPGDPCEDGVVCEGKCLGCLDTGDCDPGWQCDQSDNQCLELNCESPNKYLFAGQCVQCLGDAHCGGGLLCDLNSHECKCEDASLVLVDGDCVQCASSTHCPPGEMCNTQTNECEPFEGSCPPEKPFKLGGECVQCLDDSNCPETGCNMEKHKCFPPPLVCEPPTPYELEGECVECLEDVNCKQGQICKPYNHECGAPGGGDCVPNGNGSNKGNKIGDFTLEDCDGNPVSLHDYCGNKKAVWFVLVAGWCTACDAYASQAEGLWKEYEEIGVQLIFILGETPSGGAPTLGYCKTWAMDHGVTAPVLIDAHWETIDSKITPGGFDLPWDYLLDGDDMTFTWESLDPSPAAFMQALNNLLYN